jgi:hypothetical protein
MWKKNKGLIWLGCVCDGTCVIFVDEVQVSVQELTFRLSEKSKDWFHLCMCAWERERERDFLCVIVGDDFFFCERTGRSLRECWRKEPLLFSAAFFASLLDFISFRILSIVSHVCYSWFDYILQGFRTCSLRREKVFRRIENWRTF